MKPIARIFKQKISNTQTEEQPLILAVIDVDWETVTKIRQKLYEIQYTHSGFAFKWVVIGMKSYACSMSRAHSVHVKEEISALLGQEVIYASIFDRGAWKIKRHLFR